MKPIIVDVSPLIYASYFTLHEKVSWWLVYGVLNSFLTTVAQEQPDSIILVYGSRTTQKKALYASYHTQRTTTIKFDAKQFETLVSIFSNLNIPQLKVEGLEADQLIAACVNKFEECTIISEDKDFFQLLTDKKVLKGRRRGLWTAATVCEKYNLKDASLFADVQALTGDQTDNIPRILSMKRAIDLVNLKGRLDTWLFPTPNLDNVPKLITDKLLCNLEQIKINYALVDLRHERLKPEYFLPTQLNLPFVRDKLKKLNMPRFVDRFAEFEHVATLCTQSTSFIKGGNCRD